LGKTKIEAADALEEKYDDTHEKRNVCELTNSNGKVKPLTK